MKAETRELWLDLLSHWWQQTLRQPAQLLCMVLLALPIALLGQLFSIKYHYTTPLFSGITETQNLKQVVHTQSGSEGALAPYLADEIQQRWQVPVSYEKQNWLSVKFPADTPQDKWFASFFSGGYQLLGLRAYKGDLAPLEYPKPGSDLQVAISYRAWQTRFASGEVIGETIYINEQLATIAAIMPPQFISFRRGSQVDLVVPYSARNKLMGQSSDSLSPDVLSYIIAPKAQLLPVIASAQTALQEDVLLFEDESLQYVDAFGITAAQYQKVIKRLGWLSRLFLGLLLFSCIAYISYMASDNHRRHNEISLRALLGARQSQILQQQTLELAAFSICILVITILLTPLTNKLLASMIPDMISLGGTEHWQSLHYVVLLLTSLSAALGIIYVIQQKLMSHSLGRGAGLSLGQKWQTYGLLVLLVCISCISLLKTAELLYQQWRFLQADRGYATEQRFLVNFDMPKTGNTYFASETPKLLISALEKHPKIQQAALTSTPVLLNKNTYVELYTATMAPVSGLNNPKVLMALVSPNYFTTAGTHIQKGQSFSGDNYWQAVINQSLWNKHFNGQSLAEAKLIELSPEGQKASIDVVAVAQDVSFGDVDADAPLVVYRPIAAITGMESLMVHSSQDSDITTRELESIIADVIDNITPLLNNPKVYSVPEIIAQQNAPQLALLTTSALVSLILLLSTVVFCISSIRLLLQKSAREVSLRLALGTSPRALLFKECQALLVFSIPMILLCFLIRHEFIDGHVWSHTTASTFFALLYLSFFILIASTVYIAIARIKADSWSWLT